MSDIYNSNNANFLLGILMNDCTKVLDNKYNFDKSDFEPKLFQKIIFATIYNLAIKGVKEVDFIDIEEFLANYPTQQRVYEDNDGTEFCKTIKELSADKVENIEYYYQDIKKHSMLRAYYNSGFDISEIWDVEKSDTSNEEELNNWTIDSICDYFEKKQIEIRKKYVGNIVQEEYKAGTDFMETKEKFKETPLLGNSFQSPYLNGIFRGMYGLTLRVAKSGGGKSVLSIGDICKTTIKEYWDYDTQQFVKNKSRVGAGLFINTEMEIREQLDPLIIAWISGVERSHIMSGKYEDDEEERVDKAYEILLDSDLYIVDDPYFTVKSLTTTIRDYCLSKQVRTVCFDYIQNNGYVAKELSSNSGISQSEYQIILALTDHLKQIQRECGISLITSCQSNGNEDNTEFPTESCLAGSKGQVRKTDGTMAMFPPTKKELQQTELIRARVCSKFGFQNDPYFVNNVVHIIKGRNSEYPKHIKVFQHVDLGTGRSIDLFCTDKNNEPFKVKKLIIEVDE